jgi:hypothetical protein
MRACAKIKLFSEPTSPSTLVPLYGLTGTDQKAMGRAIGTPAEKPV